MAATLLPTFTDASLLMQALSHRSALNEPDSGTTATESNERLEFLGDAVLELVSTTYLYEKYPKEPEGMLTALRSALVKTTTLAEVAREIKLGEAMYLSHGEAATGGRDNDSLLADTLEAVIGALYLDQGIAAVNTFLTTWLFPKTETISKQKLYKDAKSLLQELVQSRGLATPVYEVIEAIGPDHDKSFTVRVLVGGEAYGQGNGRSKQAAQQEAAKQALASLES